MRDLLTYVTDFADQAVALPVLMVVAAVLMAQRRWRLSMAWLLAVCGVLGIILVLKAVLFACGWLLPSFGQQQLALTSPSGHTASAIVEYGGLALLVGSHPGQPSWRTERKLALAAIAIALVFGFTRIALGAHSVAEVLVASTVGLLGTLAFRRLAGPSLTGRSAVPACAAGLLVMALFHGQHLRAEAAIHSNTAAIIRHYAPACQLPPD